MSVPLLMRSRFVGKFSQVVVVLFLPWSPRIFANDTRASIDAGNIRFEKSSDVSMESEDLEISLDRITVDYKFRNIREKSLKTLIAFPLETLSSEAPLPVDIGNWLQNRDPINFTAKVEGVVKPTKMIVSKLDSTEDGTIFNLDVSYTWEQIFPPKRTISISHSYSAYAQSGLLQSDEKRLYCIDEKFEKALDKLKSQMRATLPAGKNSDDYLNDHMHFHSFQRLSYVLKTGNNWAGPIKRFRLRIHKPSPSSLVSLCFDGIKKVSPTVFEASKTDFRPESDLHILFVKGP